MLEELIAYLRAAMPHIRDSASSLAQEIELVRAYLGIVKVRLGDRLDYVIDLSKGDGDVRMPAMVLLPLIDIAIARGPGQATYNGVLRLATLVANRRLRITVADSGGGFAPDAAGDGIASIRARLIALYGDAASLVLRNLESGSSEAVMEIPYGAMENLAR
jgi:LytS/YehU family sensor histidine kinase